MLKEKLEGILKMIESGMEWSIAQLPLLIKEIFVWKTVEYSAWIIFGLILCALGVLLWRLRNKADDEDVSDIFTALSIFTYITSFVVIFTHVMLIIRIYVAPRLFLLDYIDSVI